MKDQTTTTEPASDPHLVVRRMPRPQAFRGGGPEHVVIVSDDAVPSGGAGMMALATAREARRQGAMVTVLSGEADCDPSLAALGIAFESLGGRHLLDGSRVASAMRGLDDRQIAARIASWIERHDNGRTIYHLHNWHKVLSPSVFRALRPIARRLIASAHDFFLACPTGGYFNFQTRAPCELKPMTGACMRSNCDKRHYAHKVWRLVRHIRRERAIDLSSSGATVLAVHEGMVDLLERGGIAASAIRVLRNPVTAWLPERILAEANIPAMFVGRLEADKGIIELVDAARRARIHLRVVGDGPLRPELEHAYPEVEFLGRLDHGAIGTVALTARLLVVPTLVRETFGLVALEGLMSGLPVITTTSALISDEIVGHGMARTCEPGNVHELAAVLAKLKVEDDTVEAMSRQAFAHARRLAPSAPAWSQDLWTIYGEKLAAASR